MFVDVFLSSIFDSTKAAVDFVYFMKDISRGFTTIKNLR